MAKGKHSLLVSLAFFGALSSGMYLLLYLFASDLMLAAEKVRSGEKLFAGVPIAVAFAFSFAHGKFTSHFWDFLGFQAKKK